MLAGFVFVEHELILWISVINQPVVHSLRNVAVIAVISSCVKIQKRRVIRIDFILQKIRPLLIGVHIKGRRHHAACTELVGMGQNRVEGLKTAQG